MERKKKLNRTALYRKRVIRDSDYSLRAVETRKDASDIVRAICSA